MLNSLATIMLVCMGVAQSSVAPIYTSNKEQKKPILTEPKKQNENEYELTASVSANTTTNYQNAIEPQTYNYIEKRIISGNNTALNIIGNSYNQYNKNMWIYNQTEQIGYTSLLTTAQKFTQETLGDNRLPKEVYALKIEPINYNSETRVEFNINFRYERPADTTEWLATALLYKTTTYITTAPQIEPYTTIGSQEYAADIIYNALENINDNYTTIKKQENYIEQLPIDPTDERYYTKTRGLRIPITITPNKTNYLFIFVETATTIKYDGTNEYENTITTKNKRQPIQTQTLFKMYGINTIPTDPNYEVIDIPGMMFQLIGMPFAFISTAFNLTIFPGTPYQLNISNLILAIFAVLVLTFLLTKVVRR